jgi:low affinity Fe/Cu permease
MSIVTQEERKLFSKIARWCSRVLGESKTFAIASVLVLLWLVSGPFFHFSTQWSLFVNTATTIFTFLFMFLIQHTQNADTRAIHLKLDEIILRNEKMDNRFMHAEIKEEGVLDELEELHEGISEDIEEATARTVEGRR